jgi:hypothetical protein
MIIENPYFRKLDETEEFILGYVFEDAYLFNKRSRDEIYIGDFYGDPTCGLISSDNDWCLVGGATLSIWNAGGSTKIVKDDDLYWVCKIRQIAPNEVKLLIDNWTDMSSIWTLNVKTLERYKLKEYLNLDWEHLEDIDW